MSETVSIITPVYNSASTLRETVESVMAQYYTHWELLLIDDCSADDSRDVMESLSASDSRIHCLYNEKNSGVALTRNHGIREATGRYIAFLDSDDTWDVDKLSRQLEFMEKVDSPFTYTSIRIMDEDGNPTGKERHVPDMVDYRTLLMGDPMPCLTIVIDTERIPREKIYMPNVHHEDYAAFLNCLRDGAVARGLDEVLASYRVSRRSVSGNKLRTATWQWRILRDQEGLSLPMAFYYLCTYAFLAIKKRL
ncbi:MAG: glycosyltransferase [Lachnospiraceae bacterium]|nr:glycosyltransferase [Lachnospiraceae bacterium]